MRCEKFRPINMFPTIDNILESIVRGQVVKYFEINKLIADHDEQYGIGRHNYCGSAVQHVGNNR